MIPSAYALAAPTVKRAMPRLAQYNKMVFIKFSVIFTHHF